MNALYLFNHEIFIGKLLKAIKLLMYEMEFMLTPLSFKQLLGGLSLYVHHIHSG